MPISFYTTRDAHGSFSNFSRHGFTLKGFWWPTSEHYFQAQKFAGTEHEEAVRRARTPKEAAEVAFAVLDSSPERRFIGSFERVFTG